MVSSVPIGLVLDHITPPKAVNKHDRVTTEVKNKACFIEGSVDFLRKYTL
jgi:hypothetical protein